MSIFLQIALQQTGILMGNDVFVHRWPVPLQGEITAATSGSEVSQIEDAGSPAPYALPQGDK